MYNYKEIMDKIIQQEIEKGEIVGANTLVLHKDKEIYSSTYGFADKENNVPMKRDTIFRMFSMTKPVTAVATMILAERGEIDLWEPVSKYLPFFANQKVLTQDGRILPAERDTTIWELLNMSSGITYPDINHEPGRQMDNTFRRLIARREKGDYVDTQEYLKEIAKVPLLFQPGTKWMYGLSADLLGGIIEVVSGKKYGAFLRDEIFIPLEMKDTGFFVPYDKRHRFAQNYIWKDGVGLIPFNTSHLGEYYEEDVAFESGGAGLVSTIDDYSRFAQMMLHNGTYEGRRILGKNTVKFMTTDHLTQEQRVDYNWDSVKGHGYSCLMRILTDQGLVGCNASHGEYGWDGWTGNYLTISPADDLVFLFFIQKCNAGTTAVVRKLRMATYGALE